MNWRAWISARRCSLNCGEEFRGLRKNSAATRCRRVTAESTGSRRRRWGGARRFGFHVNMDINMHSALTQMHLFPFLFFFSPRCVVFAFKTSCNSSPHQCNRRSEHVACENMTNKSRRIRPFTIWLPGSAPRRLILLTVTAAGAGRLRGESSAAPLSRFLSLS